MGDGEGTGQCKGLDSRGSWRESLKPSIAGALREAELTEEGGSSQVAWAAEALCKP